MAVGIPESGEEVILGPGSSGARAFELIRDVGVVTKDEMEGFSVRAGDDAVASVFAAAFEFTEVFFGIELVVAVGIAEAVEAMATAHKAMARCHLAAGAQEVFTLHPTPVSMTSEDHLDRLDAAAYGALEHSIFSAHQMGGCGMSGDAKAGVVDAEHRVKSQDGLYVVDGSVMPTSLGVNPSQTIYSLAHRAAGILSADL